MVAALLAPGGHALADETGLDVDRWVPALGVYSALNLHHIENLADSPQRELEDEGVLKAFASVQGHLELMSPALFDRLAQPRLFVRVGAGRSWDATHLTAEGKPGVPRVNPLPGGRPPPLPGVVRTGTGVRAEYAPYFYTAAAGFAFTFTLLDRSMRIKPSIEYRRGAFEIEGIVSHAISNSGDDLCPCTLGRLSTKEQKDHDLLGPGVELEFDTARAGPLMLSVFASTQAYRVLSGRKLRTRNAGFLEDGTTPLEFRARTFLDEWMFNVGVGLRLRWLPGVL